jgi:hypothetical protein
LGSFTKQIFKPTEKLVNVGTMFSFRLQESLRLAV